MSPGPKPKKRELALNQDFLRALSDQIVSDVPALRTEREFHLRKLSGLALLEGLEAREACGAGRGVEVRLPFFDIRVVKLSLSFPPNQKIRKGWTRFVMRKAMEGILPPSIQWRPGKTDMYPGWAYAYRTHENGRVEALLSNPNPTVRRYLNPDRVREVHAKFMAAEADNDEVLALWRAISLVLWLS